MNGSVIAMVFFFFKQKTAYEMIWWLEFRRVLFRSWKTMNVRSQVNEKQYSTVSLTEQPARSEHHTKLNRELKTELRQQGQLQKDKLRVQCRPIVSGGKC